MYKSTNTRVLTLALGSWLAFKEESLLRLSRNKKTIFLLAASIIYLICVTLPLGRPIEVKRWTNFILFAPVSVFVVAANVYLEQTRYFVRKLFDNPAARFIGKISYGLYLYHLPVYFLFGVLPPEKHPGPLIVVSAMACTFAVAITSYLLMEMRFLKFKERLN